VDLWRQPLESELPKITSVGVCWGGSSYDVGPPAAPTLVHRPGFQNTGPTYVSSIKSLPAAEDWHISFSALSAKVDDLLHMGVGGGIHQLAHQTPATTFLVAGDTGPEGYVLLCAGRHYDVSQWDTDFTLGCRRIDGRHTPCLLNAASATSSTVNAHTQQGVDSDYFAISVKKTM
jgi:hypothetical protein